LRPDASGGRKKIFMRIGILGTKGVPGQHGVEVVVDSMIPHLVARGYQITVYAYDSYTRNTDNHQGAQIVTVQGSRRKNLEMVSHMWNASWKSRTCGFDIIHIHSTDPCILSWIPKARYGIIATSHGQAYVRKKWSFAARVLSKIAERFFIYLPNVLTSVSRPLSDYYEKKYRKEVHYIPNGIHLRETPPLLSLERWGLSPRSYLFCSAGRMERTKGVHTLIEAYKKLQSDLPLVVAGGGSGSDTAYFQRLKNLSPHGVRFVGFLTGDDYFSLLAHARLFVFPSEYEAMSMALLEGLSFGVPTVYSDTPENEAVAKGLGYSFRVGNINSLASTIGKAQEGYEHAVALGKKAMYHMKSNHDWKHISDKYETLYESMRNPAR
jgi:glycosyltransferase involved in cell wall biosynthesis